MAQKTRSLAIAAVLFFLSGATSLVFEVVFSRQLKLVFGSTAYATSTVLAAFMGGLALGSMLLGRFADRVRRPLLLYGVIELLVGLYCVASPVVFDALPGFYLDLHERWDLSLGTVTALRFALSFGIILVPTCLMGATLPLLSRHMTRGMTALGEHVSRLYAINTFGAACGTLLATFVLLEHLGLTGTLRWTAGVNALIFVASVILSREMPPEPIAAAAASAAPRLRLPLLVMAGAFLSGCFSFMYEVVFTHLLALLTGTSIYAFGLMLFVFLCGLALGARIAQRALARGRDAGRTFGMFQMAIGVVVVAMLPLWQYVPWLFTAVGELDPGFVLQTLTRIVAVALVMLPPATLLGTAFPLVLSLATRDRATLGRAVGVMYFVNTIGAILGSTVAGFLVIPWLGAQDTLVLLACGSLALGLVFLVRFAPALDRRRPVVIVGATLAVGLLIPDWNARTLFSSQWLYFGHPRTVESVLFQHEDVLGGFTAVIEAVPKNGPKKLMMITNGKFQGDDGPQMTAQRAFAHIPMMLTPPTGKALVIGLGTGVTVTELARYPFERIDVAELAPGIVAAAREHFAHVNGGVLDNDPRVRLVINDGRNHLLLTDEKYDLVTIEVTSLFFAGAANLYSVDFYELVRDRLTDDGVLQQWIQFHHISLLDMVRIIESLRRVFPNVQLWWSGEQGLLTASMNRDAFDYDRLVAQAEAVGAGGLPLFSELLLFGESLDAALAAARRRIGEADESYISTDDLPLLEYSAPRGYALGDIMDENVAFWSRFRTWDLPPFKRPLTPDERARVRAATSRKLVQN